MRIFTVILLLATSAMAADTTTPRDLAPATFCQGQYALCIKAPCDPIVSRNKDGSYSIKEANCSCDVLTGWSMGPGSCDKRQPSTVSGRTFLVSTYSNFYNRTNLTLSCPSANTVWAWCYGAACVIDEKDPSKAVCTGPTKISAAMTLGGGCRTQACASIWSAATPANAAFANDYFFKYATQNGLTPPPNPPAKDCPATTTTTTTSAQ